MDDIPLCRCTICGTQKPFTHEFFRQDRRSTNNLRKQCLSCKQQARHINIKRYLYHLAKHRAKKRGIEFTITEQDINVPKRCPILKRKFTRYKYKNYNSDYSPSLDRIDNTKGYVPGNIMVISHRANTLKRDATIQEIRRLYLFMLAHKQSKT